MEAIVKNVYLYRCTQLGYQRPNAAPGHRGALLWPYFIKAFLKLEGQNETFSSKLIFMIKYKLLNSHDAIS